MNETHKLIISQARAFMLLAILSPFVFLSIFGVMVAVDRHLERAAVACQEACVRW